LASVISAGEHRQHAVADQFEHVAAGVVDGVDRGLRVIVEKRNDLVGRDGFADRGRSAQIGKPQHGLDALGDAARDPPAQNLLGGIAPEIDPAQRCAISTCAADLIASPSTGTRSRSAARPCSPNPSARRVSQ
jgi:hypothetical protein